MDGRDKFTTQGHEQGEEEANHETRRYYPADTQVGDTAAVHYDDTRTAGQENEDQGQEKDQNTRKRTVRDPMKEFADDQISARYTNEEFELTRQEHTSGEISHQNHPSNATQISELKARRTPDDNHTQLLGFDKIMTENKSDVFVKEEPYTNATMPSEDPRNSIPDDQHGNLHQPVFVTPNPDQAFCIGQELGPEEQQFENCLEDVQDGDTSSVDQQNGYTQSTRESEDGDEDEDDGHNLVRTQSMERFIKENTIGNTMEQCSRQQYCKQDKDSKIQSDDLVIANKSGYEDGYEYREPSEDRTACLLPQLQTTKPKLPQVRPGEVHQLFGINNHVQNPALRQHQVNIESGLHRYGCFDQHTQQPANVHDAHGYNMGYNGSTRDQAHAHKVHLRHAQNGLGVAYQAASGFQDDPAYNQMNSYQSHIPMGNQNDTLLGYQNPGLGQHNMHFQNPYHLQEMPKRATPIQAPQHLRSNEHNLIGWIPLPPAPLHQLQGFNPARKRSNMPRSLVEELECGSGEQSTDDDEPLKSRVKRQPSVTSQDTPNDDDSVMDRQPYPRSSLAHIPNEYKDQRESIESKHGTYQNPVTTPLPVPEPADTPSLEKISWKLPQFEAQYQLPAGKDDLPTVRVSIPNLVREEVILSPDHADQELHLLLNLFLPGQQALVTCDPAPAQAVLNFHTIALMVIEAFVQFEIGDELGSGSLHTSAARQREREDEDYERLHDAKDADVDEIFFEVVDRWRAGIQSNKQSLKLIRGAQEFCDTALDVIYYIKEHGLLKPESKARKERSYKGVPKGPRKAKQEDVKAKGKVMSTNAKDKSKKIADAEDEGKVSSGVKRGTEANTNVLQARKKRKVEEKKTPKAKKRFPTIVVTKKR